MGTANLPHGEVQGQPPASTPITKSQAVHVRAGIEVESGKHLA